MKETLKNSDKEFKKYCKVEISLFKNRIISEKKVKLDFQIDQ